MASIGDRVLDNGLTTLDTEANRIDICNAEPTTYTQATATYTVGNETTISIGAPADRAGGGREVTVSAISAGSVTATDTATHFAVSDTVNSRLLAVQALSASQAVTNGNTFSLTSFKIGIPDPA